MKKILFVLFGMAFLNIASAQTNNTLTSMLLHPSDHFLIQLSSDRWVGAPDSIESKRSGWSRGFNFYIMLDKPFKSNPHFSIAYGLGVGTSHIFFNKLDLQITGQTTDLKFKNMEGKDSSYDRYKLASSFIEIPLELRYLSKPENPNKAIKAALGLKFGYIIDAHTKAETLQDANGNTINDYTVKLHSQRYFNTTRVCATARLGYGNFTLFGAYNLTPIFKDDAAADMKLLQIGLTFSGL